MTAKLIKDDTFLSASPAKADSRPRSRNGRDVPTGDAAILATMRLAIKAHHYQRAS
jgi:hypothetical protein